MCFLLPSIADQSARFPFSQLLETLLKLLTKADESGGTNTKITPTPWLLYGVLAFVDNHLGMYTCLLCSVVILCLLISTITCYVSGSSSDLSVVKCYIQVLQILLVQLPHPGKQL